MSKVIWEVVIFLKDFTYKVKTLAKHVPRI